MRRGDAEPTGRRRLSFFALFGLWPHSPQLNFTSGLSGLKSALATAQVKRVVTARRLVDWPDCRRWSTAGCEIIYLEDVRKNLSLADKLTGAAGKLCRGCWQPGRSLRPAVILFTSGTEGEPKGVALSHENILANVGQARAHFDFYPATCCSIPCPSSIVRLTVGTLLPLMIG
jgi:acyl-[acyl-carrier-protein]-phospholipid O-acyltransferase/long-chain-fatty-acid--[acyl-carrier-protein] ligase